MRARADERADPPAFDTVMAVDWSARSAPAPARPSRDAIWIGIDRGGIADAPQYFRTRAEAERRIAQVIAEERMAGRRLLAVFDFPFGYPAGLARRVTGGDDPLALWDWLRDNIADDERGANNRFEVAETINGLFEGPGPFWGKTHRDRWPGVPYGKQGIPFDTVAERRVCDSRAGASSSCFQLCYHPTVGSQALLGLPMLARLRRMEGVAVWPFEDWRQAPVVLGEAWPGLVEPAVRRAMTPGAIRDSVQVRLLASALARVPPKELASLMTDLPPEAREEAWILGTGHADRLCALLEEDAPLASPPLRNDCFALPAGVDWTPVDTALDRLRAGLHCVKPAQTVPLAEAPGRVLAEDVRAVRSNPPLANTAVDGYGFAGGRGPGPHVLRLVEGRAAAGQAWPEPVPEGHAIRVLTGAALPPGVDTVVLDEDVRLSETQVAFSGPLKPGANTRQAGEDARAGETVLEAGRVLTAPDLALLSAVGVSQVLLRAPLRVAILSTGDELVEAGDVAAPGQIFDANRPMLLAAVRGFGFEPVDMGRVPDDRDALAGRLDYAARRADVILTSGGASAGDEDHVSALLGEAGALETWRIAVKPGRPLALGLWGGKPVFGLPGNPVAALVCTLVFARPALGLLAGAGWHTPAAMTLPAAFSKTKKPGRREYLRARVRDGAAEVFRSEGSGRISGLSWAEGLVELEDGGRDIRPGDPVRFIPYAAFGL